MKSNCLMFLQSQRLYEKNMSAEFVVTNADLRRLLFSPSSVTWVSISVTTTALLVCKNPIIQ